LAENIAVIYQSHYGATRQYAAWIAEELDADLMERREVSPDTLLKYDYIVYGGGLYAGGVLGADLISKNRCNNLVVFTVGLADPEITDYTAILNKNFPEGNHKTLSVFHLRGAIDYKKLKLIHRVMMAMLKKMIERKPVSKLSEEESDFIRTYGGAVDFIDRETIAPWVSYAREVVPHLYRLVRCGQIHADQPAARRGRACHKTNRGSDKKGRHTTTHRPLILLPDGDIVTNTPGMRELLPYTSDLSKTFEDIEELSRQCKHNDCSHT
jgi:flavodoxin